MKHEKKKGTGAGTPAKERGIVAILKAAAKDFGEDECGVRAAALAYFTIFALPPLLTLLVMIAGMIWDPQQVQTALETQFKGMIGPEGARQIHDMIARADQPGSGGALKTIASLAGLIFGATGVFMQLQGALNRAWEVKPDPEKGGIMRFITKRVLSLGMVLGIGFLLAVSLALTAGVSALGDRIFGEGGGPIILAIEFLVSFALLGGLFGAMFKILPDAKLAWRDALVGGAATAVLFVIGKFAIGFYLGRSKPGDAFGAAAALAVVLVWAYYSGMILLFGAEFTQQWAKRRGSGIRPEKGAVRVVETEELIRPGQPGAVQKGATTKKEDGKKSAAAATRANAAPAPETGGGIGKALLGVPIFLLLFGRKKEAEQKPRK